LHQIILFSAYLSGAYPLLMSNERERVISITLSEAEWQAFVARQPQPVSWLRDRIRDEVGPRPSDSVENKSAA
jgi:hypothetical protein